MDTKREQKRAIEESRSSKPVIPVLSEEESKYKPSATTDEMIADIRRVQEENPTKFITRNFYRVHGQFSESTWNRRFGTFGEFRCEAGLELHRGAKRLERDTALHSSLDRYRGFMEAEINPYVGKYEKDHSAKGMKTLVIGSDFHDRDLDPFVMKVFLDTIKRTQPDIVVLNGDVYDNYEFSRFDQDPRQVNLQERFDFVREQILRPIREAAPEAQIDFIIGNHDHRVIRFMADRTPHIRTVMNLVGIPFSRLLQLDEFKINLICRHDLSVYKPADTRKEILKNYKVYFDCFTVSHEEDSHFVLSGTSGHTHKPKLTTRVNELWGSTFWYTTGCMAKVDAEYVTGMNRYQNGFAVVHINPETKDVLLESVVFSDNMAVVGGKFYHRDDK